MLGVFLITRKLVVLPIITLAIASLRKTLFSVAYTSATLETFVLMLPFATVSLYLENFVQHSHFQKTKGRCFTHH